MANIGFVRLSPREWPKVGRETAKKQLKKKIIIIIAFIVSLKISLVNMKKFVIVCGYLEKLCRK